MAQTPSIASQATDDTLTDDTPLDERPPYGEPGEGPRRALIAALIAVALVVAVVVAMKFWRRVARLVAGGVVGLVGEAAATRVPRKGMIMVLPDPSPSAPVWRVRFYDDDYEQLTNRTEMCVAVHLDDPEIYRKLRWLAENLADQVERSDGARCFRPRVVLVDDLDRPMVEVKGQPR